MNSELYDNEYTVPANILKKIRAKLYTSSDSEGVKRAKNLLKSGKCTYQMLKRLKNFFDNFNPSTSSIEEFELAGGRDMRNFVDVTLKKERDRTARSNALKRPIDVLDRADDLKAQDGSVDLKEAIEDLKKNALGIIFNPDRNILILKRSCYKEQWCPNKWGLVGGGVEEGETPYDAVIRETREETGLNIDDFEEKYIIQRNPNSVEHIFITLYKGYNDDVQLNEEHSDYLWESPDLLKHHDCVPNLEEYVKLAVEKYDDEYL